jgi:hypothetical protein
MDALFPDRGYCKPIFVRIYPEIRQIESAAADTEPTSETWPILTNIPLCWSNLESDDSL